MAKFINVAENTVLSEVPFVKSVREMVKQLNEALARSHFLPKEGLP